jgi:hypothetical protein
MTTTHVPYPNRNPVPFDEALRRYREAAAHVRTSRMRWTGVALRVDGGTEYVAAFEDLRNARIREGRPWTPGESS